jgi:hypothetical protein
MIKQSMPQNNTMINKKTNCPHFHKVHTHGTCQIYPDGLMNPSLDEMKNYCLSDYHTRCPYYLFHSPEGNSDKHKSDLTIGTVLSWR